MSKLITGTPQNQLVDAYLTEIAKAYGVPWTALGDGELPGAPGALEDGVRNIS